MNEKKIIRFGNLKIDSIVLACMFSLSSIQFILSIKDRGVIIYLIFAMYVITLSYLNLHTLKKAKVTQNTLDIVIILFLMLIIIMCSIIWSYDKGNIIKLVISIIMAMLSYFMILDNVYSTFMYVVIINSIYALSLWLSPNKINRTLLSGSTNYLNMTLPLGFALTLALVFFILNMFYNKKVEPVSLIISIVMFIALSKFAARSSILFPVIVTFLMVVLIGVKKKLRFIVVAAVLGTITYFAYQYFVSHADVYIVNRMFRLFSQNSSEDRWFIWKSYIDFISRRHLWFFGGGAGITISELGYYPHNIILQMWGELGIFVTIMFMYLVGRLFLGVVSVNRKLKRAELSHEVISFYLAVAGFLYYLLYFMKSFQVYDAYLLFILMGICLKIINTFVVRERIND